MGGSIVPMIWSSNVYNEAQFFGDTHASRGFPFLGGHYPVEGVSQIEVVPCLGNTIS